MKSSAQAFRALLAPALCLWLAPTTLQAGLSNRGDGNAPHALVVGVSDYSELTDLTSPVKEVQALAAKLKEEGYAVTKLESPNRALIVDTLKEFGAKLPAGATAVVYLSGLGIHRGSESYLAPSDLSQEATEDMGKWISLSQILAALAPAEKGADTGARIVVMDICLTDPFAGDASSATTLMQEPTLGANTLVAYSTALGTDALDSPSSGTGLGHYAQAVMDHLFQPGATWQSAFAAIAQQVSDTTKGKQVPWTAGSLSKSLPVKAGPVADMITE